MARKKTSITLDNSTLKDLDDMAKDSRRSRSGMIGFLVDLFKAIIGGGVEIDEHTGQNSDVDGK